MRSALFLPLFDELADPAIAARLSAEAEQARWDGVFVWDKLRWPEPVVDVADPWITLAAIATANRADPARPMVIPLGTGLTFDLVRAVMRDGPFGDRSVATFALIHGGGGTAWDWHLVEPVLRECGHDPVAVDLPCDDESAGWSEYRDTVVRAVEKRGDLVVVAHSLGGFTAPLVCAHLRVELLVLVAGMIPSPGELFADWGTDSGYEASGYDDVFYGDVPPALAAEARRRERDETSKALLEAWPLKAWPDTPTRYLLCRDDRVFSAAWARHHARARLGIEADEIDGGHYISLSRPRELAERLHAYAAAIE